MKIHPTFRVLGQESASAEVTSVEFADVLTIRVDFMSKRAVVTFDSPTGFRVLDEGDLGSFWAAGISSKDGWLFEIASDGWLAQESQREDFVSQHVGARREFLVIGVDWCVSILSQSEPRVDWVDVA